MGLNVDLDWEEAFRYRAGQKVELKEMPGTFDTIASYEETMVPPIWLVNDPRPRYAHELRVISHPVIKLDWLNPRHYLAKRRQHHGSGEVRSEKVTH